MTKLPIVDARTMEKVLFHLEFAAVRQKGSHVFYRHPDGRATTVPHHPGRDLSRLLIRSILRDIDVSPEMFVELLEEVGKLSELRSSIVVSRTARWIRNAFE